MIPDDFLLGNEFGREPNAPGAVLVSDDFGRAAMAQLVHPRRPGPTMCCRASVPKENARPRSPISECASPPGVSDRHSHCGLYFAFSWLLNRPAVLPFCRCCRTTWQLLWPLRHLPPLRCQPPHQRSGVHMTGRFYVRWASVSPRPPVAFCMTRTDRPCRNVAVACDGTQWVFVCDGWERATRRAAG